jgi:CoA:oxalate CoA-transferase
MSFGTRRTSSNTNSSDATTADATAERSMTGLLTGIKVLSLDNYEAGNYGTALLAMHGADVVKVEVPGRGDVLRSAGPFTSGIDERNISHGELRLMRGKHSVALDLSTSEDRTILEGLISRADVFWTNLRPGSLERLRLDWPAVQALNTVIVYAGISGFGHTPGSQEAESNTPAFDITMQALGGLLERNQDENGIPKYNGIPVVDQVTSLYAAWGVLAGLLYRARTGTGVYVDVAMYDAALALN